ncbi:hypothetical protein [Roseobacter litoralis]|uniref:hypothetical protein n=1 Tax=Roseobacter litoralis TaxID=42443 RepID=UPI00249134C2|nr:hypothetical protein [Roseobacter litoralis]
MDIPHYLIEERSRTNRRRTIKVLQFVLVTTFFATHALDQFEHQIDVLPKTLPTEYRLPSSMQAFSSLSQVNEAVDRIIAASGLQQNFSVRESTEVDNAAAVIIEQERLIYYNPDFFRRVRAKTGENWAALSILAHEVGHHLNGHTLTNDGSRPPAELEADYFSGFIVRKLGGGREDAQIALKTFAPRAGSKTHPPRHERLKAVLDGWNAACRTQAGCIPDGGVGRPGLSTLPVPPTAGIPFPQDKLELGPGSVRTLHVVTDVCSFQGRTLHVTALNQVVDPNRGNLVVGGRASPLSAACVFDLNFTNGARYCVANPSGTVLVPGSAAVGQCAPL